MSNEDIACTVKWFNWRKGFGFASRDSGDGKDIFIHITALRDSNIKKFDEGQKILLNLDDGPKGPSGINIRLKD